MKTQGEIEATICEGMARFEQEYMGRGPKDIHAFLIGDLLDHRFQDRPRRFHQMGAYLFEQVSALLGRERLDQLLFGGGQDALEADHEEIIDQMGVNVLGPRPM
jgi:hypothetical protein